MPQTLQDVYTSMAANKQKQIEIKSNRASIVQVNIKTLNDLYVRMSEIFSIGKVLYAKSDSAKYADYTFTELLKKVRRAPAQNESSDLTPVTK